MAFSLLLVFSPEERMTRGRTSTQQQDLPPISHPAATAITGVVDRTLHIVPLSKAKHTLLERNRNVGR